MEKLRPTDQENSKNIDLPWTIWTHSFVMFFTEPIVLCLSPLSGFSDALIFTFLESYTPIFKMELHCHPTWSSVSVVSIPISFTARI
jgi:hypothetical protein